jgi:antitoxin component YwqK of YwqJK toxin-antitoxin module
MNQLINGKREGYWESYYSNGNLWYKGHYNNDLKEGYWECYLNNKLQSQRIFI